MAEIVIELTIMYNWNTKIPLKTNNQFYTIWKLNQLINFGLNGERLDLKLVKKNWSKLSLDPKRQRYLQELIWQKQS